DDDGEDRIGAGRQRGLVARARRRRARRFRRGGGLRRGRGGGRRGEIAAGQVPLLGQHRRGGGRLRRAEVVGAGGAVVPAGAGGRDGRRFRRRVEQAQRIEFGAAAETGQRVVIGIVRGCARRRWGLQQQVPGIVRGGGRGCGRGRRRGRGRARGTRTRGHGHGDGGVAVVRIRRQCGGGRLRGLGQRHRDLEGVHLQAVAVVQGHRLAAHQRRAVAQHAVGA